MSSQAFKCPHMRDGLCEVSTQLTGVPVLVAEDACTACMHQRNPQTVNPVTCSKAIHTLRSAGLPITPELIACARPPTSGVGTELANLIDITRSWLARIRLDKFIPGAISCGCDSLKSVMNSETPHVCWEKRSHYISNIAERWLAHHPAIRFLPLKRWLITAYLWKAVRQALRKETH